ncbi:MAG: hypothetical protein PHF36_03700 [Candidatus Cloacimonetes bacterium]|nr:hypothetical protein [Candidatus Cloacimonadota bacterium]
MKKIYYGFIVIFVIAGCNVFTPRDSEKPSKPAEWNTFPITAQQSLENLVFAYNYRENVYNYASLFSDDFLFYFDNQDVLDFSLPTYWNKNTETETLMNVYQRINDSSTMYLKLQKIQSQNDNVQADRAWFYRSYELTMSHSIDNTPTLFVGQFGIFMEKENSGFWKIKEWNDYRLQADNWTWGRAKNEFSL